ncbi:hypothetical protein H4Q26_017042 [Puccinia striiformis f. sp. tritici PST-130]|nr:hypothetical protein H4Q26_017042 [Puccinia striiformis f. sp. tritici PST-130]
MSNLLECPLKQTSPIDLGSGLLNYIQSYHEDHLSHPEVLKPDLDLINGLRTSIEDKLPIDQSTLDHLIRYHAHLTYILPKFPDDVGVEFTYSSIFSSTTTVGSILPGELPSCLPITLSNLKFERACVLFNIGAISMSLGTQSPRTNTEQLKRVIGFFQQAAALSQAQESVWQQAIKDQKSNGTISRIAQEASRLYSSTFNFMKDVQKLDIHWIGFAFPDDWISYVQLKSAHFLAVAQFRKGMDDSSAREYGIEVGRLEYGCSSLKAAITSATKTNMNETTEIVLQEAKNVYKKLTKSLEQATKDNDLIYLKHVPSVIELPIINPSHSSNLPFPNLSPILQSSSKMRKMLENYLKILFLIRFIRSFRTTDQFTPFFDSVEESSLANSNGLKQITKKLDDESREDQDRRTRFGTQLWQRDSSEITNRTLREQENQLLQTFASAVQSDRQVKERYDKWHKVIELLCQDEETIRKAIPPLKLTDRSTEDLSLSSWGTSPRKLRKLLDDLEDLRIARKRILGSAINFSSTDSIDLPLIEKFNQDLSLSTKNVPAVGSSDIADITNDEHIELFIDTHLQKYSKFIVNQEFLRSRIDDPITKSRENIFQELDSGYHEFHSIVHNLQEGLQFHSQFNKYTIILSNQVDSYLEDRRRQATGLESELNQLSLGNTNNSTPRGSSQKSNGKKKMVESDDLDHSTNQSIPQHQQLKSKLKQKIVPQSPVTRSKLKSIDLWLMIPTRHQERLKRMPSTTNTPAKQRATNSFAREELMASLTLNSPTRTIDRNPSKVTLSQLPFEIKQWIVYWLNLLEEQDHPFDSDDSDVEEVDDDVFTDQPNNNDHTQSVKSKLLLDLKSPEHNSILALSLVDRTFYEICRPFIWQTLDLEDFDLSKLRRLRNEALSRHADYVRRIWWRVSTTELDTYEPDSWMNATEEKKKTKKNQKKKAGKKGKENQYDPTSKFIHPIARLTQLTSIALTAPSEGIPFTERFIVKLIKDMNELQSFTCCSIDAEYPDFEHSNSISECKSPLGIHLSKLVHLKELDLDSLYSLELSDVPYIDDEIEMHTHDSPLIQAIADISSGLFKFDDIEHIIMNPSINPTPNPTTSNSNSKNESSSKSRSNWPLLEKVIIGVDSESDLSTGQLEALELFFLSKGVVLEIDHDDEDSDDLSDSQDDDEQVGLGVDDEIEDLQHEWQEDDGDDDDIEYDD